MYMRLSLLELPVRSRSARQTSKRYHNRAIKSGCAEHIPCAIAEVVRMLCAVHLCQNRIDVCDVGRLVVAAGCRCPNTTVQGCLCGVVVDEREVRMRLSSVCVCVCGDVNNRTAKSRCTLSTLRRTHRSGNGR